MTDKELRQLDHEQLLAEKEVLEELLRANPWVHRAGYWREELERVKRTLQSLSLKSDA